MARTMTPANPGSKKIYMFLVETFGTVSAAARAANLPDKTVCRYISDPPKRPQVFVVSALEKLGVKREWIDAATS